jgi:hypothetical protein
MEIELVLDVPSNQRRSFRFSLSEPVFSSEKQQYHCCYEVTGLFGTRGPRYANGRDPLEAIDGGLYALTVVANCLPSTYCVSEEAFSTTRGVGLGFRSLPDLQFGMTLFKRAQFMDALPYLLPYAVRGTGEIQLALGNLLFLAAPSDSIAARVAFNWCEKAAVQGIGQAYQYMAEICRRFPLEFRDKHSDVGRYETLARELGFYLPGVVT